MFILNTLRGVCTLVSILSLVVPVSSNDPPKPLSLGLGQALEVSLANHPKIKAMLLQLESKRAEARQVAMRMNPELELEFENFRGNKYLFGTEGLETTASISQVVELGGKRKMRTRVKQNEVQILLNEIEIIKQEVIEETTNAFIKALASQAKHRLSGELESIARRNLEVITKRVDLGKVAFIDQERAGFYLTKLKLKHEDTIKEVNTAFYKLG